jgi:hypothetical protein
LTQYAGLGTNASWRFDKHMPVVQLASLPSTWFGVVWETIWDPPSVIDDALTEFCSDVQHPETADWGIGATARQLKFFDPSGMMDGIDSINAQTAWSDDRGVTIRYDAPATASLEEWRR